MMQCPECKVGYTGDITLCPLCGHELDGTVSPSPFPVIALERKSNTARHVLAAVTLTLLACILALGIAFGTSPLMLAAVSIALALNYLFVRNIIAHSPDFMRVIQRYFLVLEAMAVLWFVATQSEMVATFVIPTLSIVGLLFDGALLVVFRSSFIKGYAKYLLYAIVLGALPPLLMLTGKVVWPYLACLSAALAVSMAVCLLLFARRSTSEEAKRLFII